MTQKDSIKLLRECEAGCAMGISSIDEILDKVRDDKYVQILQESKDHHDKLKNEIHDLLMQAGSDDKEPSMMAETMASSSPVTARRDTVGKPSCAIRSMVSLWRAQARPSEYSVPAC